MNSPLPYLSIEHAYTRHSKRRVISKLGQAASWCLFGDSHVLKTDQPGVDHPGRRALWSKVAVGVALGRVGLWWDPDAVAVLYFKKEKGWSTGPVQLDHPGSRRRVAESHLRTIRARRALDHPPWSKVVQGGPAWSRVVQSEFTARQAFLRGPRRAGMVSCDSCSSSSSLTIANRMPDASVRRDAPCTDPKTRVSRCHRWHQQVKLEVARSCDVRPRMRATD